MSTLFSSCLNHKQEDYSTIECIKEQSGNILKRFPSENEMVVVIHGDIIVSYGEILNESLGEGMMILLPMQSNCNIDILGDAFLIFIRLKKDIRFCDYYSLETLLEEGEQNSFEKKACAVKLDERLTDFFDILCKDMQKGIECNYFFDIKLKELLFLLRLCLSREHLYGLFYPILTSDMHFSSLVYKYYKEAKTVAELANILNYSRSGFEKKFKKIFGVSVYQWMQSERAKNIYHEISFTKKTFTEIAFENGFSSPSHFNDFCRLTFNSTPGEIRKKMLNNID